MTDSKETGDSATYIASFVQNLDVCNDEVL